MVSQITYHNFLIAFSINLTVKVEERDILVTAELQQANAPTILVLNYLTFGNGK